MKDEGQAVQYRWIKLMQWFWTKCADGIWGSWGYVDGSGESRRSEWVVDIRGSVYFLEWFIYICGKFLKLNWNKQKVMDKVENEYATSDYGDPDVVNDKVFDQGGLVGVDLWLHHL